MKIFNFFVIALWNLNLFVLSQNQRGSKMRNSTRTVNAGDKKSITINNYIDCRVNDFMEMGKGMQPGGLKGKQDLVENQYECPLTSYLFPRGDQTTDYIRVKTPVPDLLVGTVCSWLSIGPDGVMHGTLVSYATIKQFNSLILYGYKLNNSATLDVFINNEGYFISIRFPPNRHVHFCLSFSILGGYVKIYQDGILSGSITRFKNKAPIGGGGVFIIGQEQDGLASGFTSTQALSGTVSNFMMWDRELDEKEIRMMASPACKCPGDHIISLNPSSVMLMGGVCAQTIQKCPATK